ncbi:hypothetical protein BST61_g4366 [Cercospora zeina]
MNDRSAECSLLIQIQAVLANMATVVYSYVNPFQHALHVRCDDPGKRCQNRPQDDPCQPNPPNPGDKPKKLPNAYSTNTDFDDGYPMINFCEGFMNLRSFADGYSYGNRLIAPAKYDTDQYNNRATTFFHELTHLDLAADSANGQPNPSIDDLTIAIKLGSSGRTANFVAYGGLATNRWLVRQRTQVIMCNETLTTLPWAHPERTDLGAMASLSFAMILDTDASTLGDALPNLGDYPGCGDRTDPSSETVIAINDLLPLTSYPSDYVGQQTTWLQKLGGHTETPSNPDTPTTTDAPIATPAPPNINACHGISGDYWVMSRDTAVENAKDFCSQPDKTKTYNAGSVNELSLSIPNLADPSKSPQDDPNCLIQFPNAVIDSCDGTDPNNNPHNYKSGSTLSTSAAASNTN